MVFFNYSTMQMAAKVVYYGPGLCGKTTNLQWIFDHTSNDSRGEMVSLATETDRTLFFDLLPIDVGTIAGFNTRIQLYTVPGQVFYNTTRKLVLKGVDGVVFVADSQRPMLQANIDSLDNLEENLNEMGLTLAEIPVVLQFNKRDLPNVMPPEELNEALNRHEWGWTNASAIAGDGVFETLKMISKATLLALKKRLTKGRAEGAGPGRGPASPGARPLPKAPVRAPLPPRPAAAPKQAPAPAPASGARPSLPRPAPPRPVPPPGKAATVAEDAEAPRLDEAASSEGATPETAAPEKSVLEEPAAPKSQLEESAVEEAAAEELAAEESALEESAGAETEPAVAADVELPTLEPLQEFEPVEVEPPEEDAAPVEAADSLPSLVAPSAAASTAEHEVELEASLPSIEASPEEGEPVEVEPPPAVEAGEEELPLITETTPAVDLEATGETPSMAVELPEAEPLPEPEADLDVSSLEAPPAAETSPAEGAPLEEPGPAVEPERPPKVEAPPSPEPVAARPVAARPVAARPVSPELESAPAPTPSQRPAAPRRKSRLGGIDALAELEKLRRQALHPRTARKERKTARAEIRRRLQMPLDGAELDRIGGLRLILRLADESGHELGEPQELEIDLRSEGSPHEIQLRLDVDLARREE